jgi:hypothetical protein
VEGDGPVLPGLRSWAGHARYCGISLGAPRAVVFWPGELQQPRPGSLRPATRRVQRLLRRAEAERRQHAERRRGGVGIASPSAASYFRFVNSTRFPAIRRVSTAIRQTNRSRIEGESGAKRFGKKKRRTRVLRLSEFFNSSTIRPVIISIESRGELHQ